jgi:UDP-N-acetylglucosamine transferase subunit ALG13
MVPLAKALLERGDDVVWAAAAEPAGRLRADGFSVIESGMSDAEGWEELARGFPDVANLAPSERPAVVFPRIFGSVRAGPMLADLLPAATEWRPSLVVRDASEFAGPIVAAKLGVPSVTHSFGTLRPEPLVAAASDVVAPLWEQHGLAPRPYGGSYDHLYLDIYPRSLRSQDVTHAGNIQALQPVAFATPGDDGASPDLVTEDSSLPLVYVTFGTVFNTDASLIATVVGAIAELRVRVIATVGPAGDPASLGPQPANVAVERYIPQTELLSRCAVVVSHAGSGTFLAGLSHGLPQLCIPQGADQFENAAAAARSGAGIVLSPGDVTPESVREATKRLLGESGFGAAAARLSSEIASMPPPDQVAGVLADRFESS